MAKLFTLSLIPALLLTGCFPGPTDSQAGAPANSCPAVECGWHHNEDTDTDQCSGDFTGAQQQRFDPDTGCSTYSTVCVTPGTPAECIPDACRREHVTCADATAEPAHAPTCPPAGVACGWRYDENTGTDECEQGYVRAKQVSYQQGTGDWYHDTVCVLPAAAAAALPLKCVQVACHLGFVTGQP